MDDEQAPSVPVDCEGPRRGFFLQKRSKLEGKKTKYINSSSVQNNWQIQENVESWTIKYRANINPGGNLIKILEDLVRSWKIL